VNDPVDPAVRSRAVAAARGHAPFDLLIGGGTVVDVGLGTLRAADVGIVGPLIASVHPPGSRRDAVDTIDAAGRFVAPGFMDLHVHFESSMLTPRAYAEAVVPRGTTTVFADPHELGNVAGLSGVRYALDASRGLPLRFVIQAPSCVPPMPGLELSGADFDGEHVGEMLGWHGVGGVAEVMDMLGVLERRPRMVDVVEAGLARGALVSGHAFGLAGATLQAYLCAGITSDHESVTPDDVIARLEAGMTVELRGALEFMLPPVVEWLKLQPMVPTHLVLSTDDVFADVLLREGGIDWVLRRLIGYGLDPVQAIRLATINGAYRLQRTDLGLVGAGRAAEIVILDDLASVAVNEVIVGGVVVARSGRLVGELPDPPADPPRHTVHVPTLSAGDFELRLPGQIDGTVTLRTIENPLFTSWGSVDVEVRNGRVEVPDGYLLQVAVHRYGRAPATPQVALLGGWGDWTGAIATTVAHDTHNLVVFGRDPVDMAVAANAVVQAHGGVAVAAAGRVTALLPLPIAGILSPGSAAEVAASQRDLTEAALAVGQFSPVLTMPLFQVMVSSLACLPGPHLTDVGLVDGTTGERISSPVLR